MIPLYTENDFNNALSADLLDMECYNCKKPFKKAKRTIIKVLNNIGRHNGKYCQNCKHLSKVKLMTLYCQYCEKVIKKTPAEIRKNNFCSKSCAASFNNKHKTHGTRRSKLEVYLEEQLTSHYPNMLIDYNRKDAIESELDIYIPTLKLAFELNGIFHYEPIFGSDKLNQVQNNDISKSKACINNEIDLCIIDTSGLKYFKPDNAKKYLDIIVNIINQRSNI